MVLPGNVIGILDFGMVGQLSQTDRSALVEFVIALGRDDISRIVENNFTKLLELNLLF